MSRPLLSICIPSYNRAHLLIELLQELDTPDYLPLDFEVLVVNNGSPEEDYAAIRNYSPRHFEYRYLRNPETIPAYHNCYGTLRRARGELCLYLADDDRLVPDNLTDAITRMLADPTIMATFCLWGERDGITGAMTPPPYPLPDQTYDLSTSNALMANVFQDNLFLPEIGVYRTDAVARCLMESETFYHPFPFIDRLLRLGQVRLTPSSFYLCSARIAGEPYPRPTLGQTLPFDTWERIRRSLELIQYQYMAPGPDAATSVVNRALLEHFLWSSCSSAWNSNNYLLSWELTQSLKARHSAYTGNLAPELTAAFEYFGAIGGFAKSLAWQPEIRRVLVHTLPDYLQSLILDALRNSISADVVLESQEGPASADLPADAVLLVAEEAERERLIAEGAPPGLVMSLQGLRDVFLFMPPRSA